MAGYSGTPLARKLGITGGSRLYIADAPPHYRELLEPLPPDVAFAGEPSADVDLLHLFFTRATDLGEALATLRNLIDEAAAVWISWPKKSAKTGSDITEDVVRALALPLGFVDTKVCAVDETWSGLKLVVRKELRGRGRR